MRRSVTAAACLLAALAVAPAARAADVAVVRAAGDDAVLVEATARLGLELSASGLTSAVVELAGDGAPARVAFVREDGVATIDLVGTRPDATQVHRRVRVPSSEGGDDPAVLALRAVELLRGIRLEVARLPATPPSPPPAPEPAPDGDVFRVSVGAGLLEGSDGLAPVALGPTLSLAGRVLRHVSIVVAAAGPFFDDLGPTPSGSARIRQELGLFGLRLDARWSRVRVGVLLGSGAHHLRATFDARGLQPASPQTDLHLRTPQSVWSPFVAAGAGASGRVWRWLGASVELTALVLKPALDVTVDGRLVGRMGGPSLLETVSLWVAFP